MGKMSKNVLGELKITRQPLLYFLGVKTRETAQGNRIDSTERD